MARTAKQTNNTHQKMQPRTGQLIFQPRGSLPRQTTRERFGTVRSNRSAMLSGASRRILALLLILLPFFSLACSAAEGSWEDGPTSNNISAMDTFFSDWLDYAEENPPAEFTFPSDEAWDDLVHWRDFTYSGSGVSHAQIELSGAIGLGLTAANGTVTRTEVTCEESPGGEPLSAEEQAYFILACECTAYAFAGEHTLAGPASLVSKLLADLEADSRVRKEGKIPSASAQFARRSFLLETNADQTSLAFVGTV